MANQWPAGTDGYEANGGGAQNIFGFGTTGCWEASGGQENTIDNDPAVTDPAGTNFADKLECAIASTAFFQATTSRTWALGSYYLSAIVKYDGGSFNHFWMYGRPDSVEEGKFFDLANGTVGSDVTNPPAESGIVDYGGGWYRCWIRCNASVSSTTFQSGVGISNVDNNRNVTGVIGDGIHIWAAWADTVQYTDWNTPGEYTANVQTSPKAGYLFGQVAANDTGATGVFDDDTDVSVGDDYYGEWDPTDPTDLTNADKGVFNGVTLPSTYTYQVYDVSLGEWSNAGVESFSEEAGPVAPTWSTIPDQSFNQGDAVNLDLSTYITAGDTPITYTSVGAALPTGLTLTGSVISGTASAAGNFNGTQFRATNATGFADSNLVDWDITSVPVAPTWVTIPDIQRAVDVPLSFNLALYASGTSPITYTIETGTLPTGLSLASNGLITGTPTVIESQALTYRATNSQGFDVSNSATISIVALDLSNASLNDAILAVTGGPTVMDGLMSYYLSNGASPGGALVDIERQFLLAQPQTSSGTNQDLWRQLLTGLGFTGTLNDQWLQFWRSGGI